MKKFYLYLFNFLLAFLFVNVGIGFAQTTGIISGATLYHKIKIRE